jgi:hypothetical protein
VSDPEQTFGHTFDADEATMEEMRRYADAARKAAKVSNGAHTIDADAATMEEMRRFADEARAGATEVAGAGSGPPPPAASEVTLPVPEAADDATAAVAPERPVNPADTIERLPSAPGPVPMPPDLPGERWQPPPRTVMPVAPQPAEAIRAPGLWKPAAIVLGVVSAVLAAFLIFGGSSGDEQPGGSTVPGSSVAASVPEAGSVSIGDD